MPSQSRACKQYSLVIAVDEGWAGGVCGDYHVEYYISLTTKPQYYDYYCIFCESNQLSLNMLSRKKTYLALPWRHRYCFLISSHYIIFACFETWFVDRRIDKWPRNNRTIFRPKGIKNTASTMFASYLIASYSGSCYSIKMKELCIATHYIWAFRFS